MVNKSIVDYLKKGKNRGFTYQRLKQELVKNKFNSKEIDEAIAFLGGGGSLQKKIPLKKPVMKTSMKKPVQKKVPKTVQKNPVTKTSKQIKPIIPKQVKEVSQPQTTQEKVKQTTVPQKKVKVVKQEPVGKIKDKKEKAPSKTPKWFWFALIAILLVAGVVVIFFLF